MDLPVSGSIISWMLSIFPKGSNIPLNISSVMLKCKDPTYNLIGPVIPFGMRFGMEFPILFFSAWVCCTIIGTPNSFWPDRPRAYKEKSITIIFFYKSRNRIIPTYQSDAFRIFKLDIGYALKAPGLITHNHSNVSHFTDRTKKFFQISRAYPLGQLHDEHGPGISLLRTQIFQRRRTPQAQRWPRPPRKRGFGYGWRRPFLGSHWTASLSTATSFLPPPPISGFAPFVSWTWSPVLRLWTTVSGPRSAAVSRPFLVWCTASFPLPTGAASVSRSTPPVSARTPASSAGAPARFAGTPLAPTGAASYSTGTPALLPVKWKVSKKKLCLVRRVLNAHSEERCLPTSPFSLDLPLISSYEQHKVKRTRRWGKTDNINKV